MMAPTRRSVLSLLSEEPNRLNCPAVGLMRPSNMFMVVVLPEPLGPSNPKTWPRGTWMERSSTARIRPKRLVRPLVLMT